MIHARHYSRVYHEEISQVVVLQLNTIEQMLGHTIIVIVKICIQGAPGKNYRDYTLSLYFQVLVIKTNMKYPPKNFSDTMKTLWIAKHVWHSNSGSL